MRAATGAADPADVVRAERNVGPTHAHGGCGAHVVMAPAAARAREAAEAPAPAPAPAPSVEDAAAGWAAENADQRQQGLRQQQQRLLLLRHASKCPHENGNCPVTPHCVGMKRLRKHIAECKDQQCQMAHCVSSRYVLSHYHRCKDPRCAVCGPVREAIQRNHEKAKQLAMAQS